MEGVRAGAGSVAPIHLTRAFGRDLPARRSRTAASVLILRPDNLGDVILFSGVFRHIRQLYPTAEIVACVKEYAADLLRFCPYIDRIIVWEEAVYRLPERFRHFRGWARAERALRSASTWTRLRTDVLLCPVRSPTVEMNAFARAVRARERYGVVGDWSNLDPEGAVRQWPDFTNQVELAAEHKAIHEILVHREFVRLLGGRLEQSDLWPEFWTDEQDREWARDRVYGAAGGIILGIAPGSGSFEEKGVPPERIAQAVRDVPEHIFDVRLFGSADESGLCDQVAKALAGAANVRTVQSFAGETSIRMTIEGLRRCDAVLSLDTAALHAAIALRKPTVGIVGGGHFGRFHPWGDPERNRTVYRPLDCYGCGWNCRYAPTIPCMTEISHEMITRELRSVSDTALEHAATRLSGSERRSLE